MYSRSNLPWKSINSDVNVKEDVYKIINIRLRCEWGRQCGRRRGGLVNRGAPAVEEQGFRLHHGQHGYSTFHPCSLTHLLFSLLINLISHCSYLHPNTHCIAPRLPRRFFYNEKIRIIVQKFQLARNTNEFCITSFKCLSTKTCNNFIT